MLPRLSVLRDPLLVERFGDATPDDQAVQRFYLSLLPALQVAMLATKLYGLRMALWVSAILPMALGYAVGMIDAWSSARYAAIPEGGSPRRSITTPSTRSRGRSGCGCSSTSACR